VERLVQRVVAEPVVALLDLLVRELGLGVDVA